VITDHSLTAVRLHVFTLRIFSYGLDIVCGPLKIVECYSNHIITRISVQTAGLAFGGTGLCTYRVRGVYLPTVILTITWYFITHSLFHSMLKTSLFCKSFLPQPFIFLLQDSLHGFPRLFTVISEHICFLLLVFLFLHFLVVGSVR